uniref:Mitochondrial inner membrane protein OXA1L n=2 Tax=Schistosoma mansoni TaxID=6183 RepID=A0A5K4FEN9_SCHMA
MIRLSRITKIFSETVLIQKTSSVPSMMRKLSTNTYLSAPSDCILPEPPLPPNEVVLNTLGEPTLASLGLNSYWPSGWYQSLLETLHVHLDLPWWGAIAASTILIRMCMFPVMVRQRRHLAEYTNIIPQVTVLQESLTRARLSGNYVEMMRTSEKMSQLMKNNNLNPLNTFKYVFLQAPIFLGVFTGIRGLVNLPVTSLQTGGTAWFTDLTASDPYCILPFLSMSLLLLTFETGAELRSGQTQPTIRVFSRALPVVGFLFVMNMPSALVWYWTVSNLVSLLQSVILRQRLVRSYLNLPSVRKPPPVIEKKRGFIAGFKESLNNSRLLAELDSRERIDAKAWQKSGHKTPPVTFISDPTKLTSNHQNVFPPDKTTNNGYQVQLEIKQNPKDR